MEQVKEDLFGGGAKGKRNIALLKGFQFLSEHKNG